MAAFKYSEGEKSKQKKIIYINYTKLEMQEYLLNGDRNKEVTNNIFKARSPTWT